MDILTFLNYLVKLYAEKGRVVRKKFKEVRGRNRIFFTLLSKLPYPALLPVQLHQILHRYQNIHRCETSPEVVSSQQP